MSPEAIPVEPCRYCGVPRAINAWCGSSECADRVARAQREDRELRSVRMGLAER